MYLPNVHSCPSTATGGCHRGSKFGQSKPAQLAHHFVMVTCAPHAPRTTTPSDAQRPPCRDGLYPPDILPPVTIDELAANREWLSDVRTKFEATLGAEERSDPATQSVIQHTVRLIGIALDYHEASKPFKPQLVENCVRIAAMLGKEWTGLADDLSIPQRMVAIERITRLYSEGLAYVSRQATDDPDLTSFLSVALVTWGSFYSRVEMWFPGDDPDQWRLT